MKIVTSDQTTDSWIFPAPWIAGPLIGPSHWDYCCFRLPLLQEFIYVKITTTLVNDYGAPNDAHERQGVVCGEDSGFFTTTLYTEYPAPSEPPSYGFNIFEPIPDPTGPYSKSDPQWNFLGQWLGHKIGGAPMLRVNGPVIEEVKVLLQDGYELLLQLEEPSWSTVDPQQCDDYMGDWLFQKDRFNVLIHPMSLDVRYVWG